MHMHNMLTCIYLLKSAECSIFKTLIPQLSRHHYVRKAQAKYFKDLKDNLPEGDGCLVGDFAENYSFIVQDAAQGFHWENSVYSAPICFLLER